MSGEDGGLPEKVGLIVLGAIATIIVQLILKRYSARADAYHDSLDQFCDDIRELATAAEEYWACSADDDDFQKLEAKVFGLNHRMMAGAGLLGEERDEFRTITQDFLLDLAEAATGGGFEVKGRPAEPERYRRIERSAIELAKAVRRYQRRLRKGWLW